MEIFTNGQWGRVCSDAWDVDDAHVTCRKLGYVGALDAPEIWSWSYRPELIRLSNVQCNGTEESLCDCVSSGIGNPAPCPAFEAGAICQSEWIDPQSRHRGQDCVYCKISACRGSLLVCKELCTHGLGSGNKTSVQ